ncbi:hypothetical protein BMS3Bbin06_00698 [bacterium BMS3Bbin06]|nr:hypothetical protein BMS3Abin08_01311 [bacterium BMS3Abin08]GBE34178.1 hypothetical protein BMS3Bbin06_00698 [bacterium BMS3Bbin06]
MDKRIYTMLPFCRIKIDKKLFVLFVCLCLLTILVLGMIGHANDLSDTYDATVIASLFPIALFHDNEVVFLKLVRELFCLPLIDIFSLQSRAPPAVL